MIKKPIQNKRTIPLIGNRSLHDSSRKGFYERERFTNVIKWGIKIIQPIITAAIAHIKTAPAAKSFIFLILSLYSGHIKSHRYSTVVFTASVAITIPIAKIQLSIPSSTDRPRLPKLRL